VRLLCDSSLRDSEETDIEVVQVVFGNAPFFEASFVGLEEACFFIRAYPSKSVVGRVAKDNEDGGVTLDVLGGVAFFFKFGEQQALLRFFRGFPAGQSGGKGEADTIVALLS